MRLSMKHVLAGFAVLTMTMPVWAHTYKEPLDLGKKTMLGTTQLNPGSYELSADDTAQSLNILQKGKVIATVQGQWVKLPQKAEAPSTVSDGDKITQVQFGGSNQAFQLQ
jgi:hypothetical protein